MSEISATSSTWILCPRCKGKTRTKIFEDSVLIKFPLYCPNCKKEMVMDIVQQKMLPHGDA